MFCKCKGVDLSALNWFAFLEIFSYICLSIAHMTVPILKNNQI